MIGRALALTMSPIPRLIYPGIPLIPSGGHAPKPQFTRLSAREPL